MSQSPPKPGTTLHRNPLGAHDRTSPPLRPVTAPSGPRATLATSACQGRPRVPVLTVKRGPRPSADHRLRKPDRTSRSTWRLGCRSPVSGWRGPRSNFVARETGHRSIPPPGWVADRVAAGADPCDRGTEHRGTGLVPWLPPPRRALIPGHPSPASTMPENREKFV